MPKIPTFYIKIILSLFLLSLSTTNYAVELNNKENPKWELGVGIGGISLPHYRGSDQRSEYLAPIPYFRYNGERLKIDREGGSFYFYNSESLKFDISTAFSLPVDNKDNRAREGMENLGIILELGPRVEFNLYQSKNKDFRVRFALPLREAYDLSHTTAIGWVFSPYLQLRYFDSGWESAVSAGPIWASEKYHDYFYEVSPQYATASRQSFNAQAGYSGSRLTLTLDKRFDKIFLGIFARYDDLHNASFIDSPLLKQNDSFMIGAALSWVFKSSKKHGQY